jgi:hypothetical protein
MALTANASASKIPPLWSTDAPVREVAAVNDPEPPATAATGAVAVPGCVNGGASPHHMPAAPSAMGSWVLTFPATAGAPPAVVAAVP